MGEDISCQCGGEKITVVSVEGRRYQLSVWREEDNSQLSVWRGENDSCQCGGEKTTVSCQCGAEKNNSQLSVWNGEDNRRGCDEVEKIPHVVC